MVYQLLWLFNHTRLWKSSYVSALCSDYVLIQLTLSNIRNCLSTGFIGAKKLQRHLKTISQ